VARAALAFALAAALVAGCGDDSSGETTTTMTTTASETTTARVYFLRDGKVWPVAREVGGSVPDAAALTELFEGPTDEEREALGATSAIPGGSPSLRIEDGVARFQPQGDYPRAALAQIVYTLTQFPSIEAVDVDKRYTRADFEDQTPSVLVESPLPFEEVDSPLRVTGTANTFEATFNYELTDTDGLIVDENFVTATSGTGQRGTFDFTTDAYEIPFDGIGELIVFERSAEDGSKIHLVEIPLRMSK
jgi:germination protein M